MSWAEIKYALNDTVGTAEFEPLNKLIAHHIGLQENTDRVYAIKSANIDIKGGQETDQVTQNLSPKVNFNCSGTVRVTTEWEFTPKKSRSCRAYVYIYKNNEQIATNSCIITSKEEAQLFTVGEDLLIGVSPGDTISFKVNLSGSSTQYAPDLATRIKTIIRATPVIVGADLVTQST